MLKRYLAATAVTLSCMIFISKATAQTPSLVDNDEAAKKADAYLAQWDKKDMPGCAVGAVQGGKLVYKRAFGMANLDYDAPNTTTTLFNTASLTKQFTAMSIALLAQQGKLSLDDDVRKYVPELPKYADTVTIRHLIHQTSGIREYEALVLLSGQAMDSAYSSKAMLNMLARQKNISFKPGLKHQYSNSNYFLLGIIVERVSGKSLRTFTEENIFKPLGMKNTQFFDNNQEVIKNRASGYIIGADKKISLRASLFNLVGASGLLTTVEDLYLWDQNFYEPKVGNKQLIELITTPGTLNDGEKMSYAFGLVRGTYKGLPIVHHGGNMGGYRSYMTRYPEQKFAAIALCNNMAILPSAIVQKLADIYLDGQLKPAPPSQKPAAESLPPAAPLPEKEALRYPGVYASQTSGSVFRLSVKDGKLINNWQVQNEIPMTPVAENRFVLMAGNKKYELTPIFNQAGAISEIRSLAGDGKTTDVFLPVKPAPDAPEKLAEYAGIYHSEEFKTDYKLSLEGNNLILQVSENLKPQITPAYLDYFTLDGGVMNLSFSRDAQGKITGFIFNSSLDGRDVKGIAFQRR